MADQQYIYIAAAPAVVAPASYGYSGYTQPAEASYVQPGYTPAPVAAYTYDQGQFASAVVSHSSYGQPEYTQSSYTSPVQSSYSQPGAYGATVTTYVSASPYNVVSSAYAAPTEQAPTYGQPSYAQPVVGYSPTVAQPSSAYGQPPAQQTVVYGQLSSQQPVAIGQPGVQQPTAYVQPGQQTPLYGQPPTQQQPSAYVPPPAAAVQQAFAYAAQAPGTPQPSPYGQPLVQAAPLGAPPSAQHPSSYIPAVAAQQAPSYGQPATQQPPPYGQPSAGQPPVYGQPPAQPNSFNQAPSYIPPSPVPLPQPPVFIAAAGGPPGVSPLPPIQPLPAPGSIGHLGGGPGLFGRGRGGIGGLGGGGGPGRGFGGERGGGDRLNNPSLMPIGEIEVQQFPDTIFVQGLSEDVSEETLTQHFGAIGKLKTDTKTGKPRVWLVRDKVTGRPRGEATIGYEDVGTVSTAIDLFNNKEFQGRKIRVQVASRKIPAGAPPNAPSIGSDRSGMGGRGRSGGSSGSGGGGGGSQPDWICRNMDCGNQNFGWRQECNRCKAPRDGSANSENGPEDGPLQVIRGGFRGGLGPRGGRGGNRGGPALADGDRGGPGLGRGPFRGGMMMNAIGPMGFRGRGGPMRGRDRMERRGRPY